MHFNRKHSKHTSLEVMNYKKVVILAIEGTFLKEIYRKIIILGHLNRPRVEI